MRYKVLFKGSNEIKKFAEAMNSFTPDINLYFGHQIFDAKSIICLMSLQLFKKYEVEIITDNPTTKDIFSRIVSKFGG